MTLSIPKFGHATVAMVAVAYTSLTFAAVLHPSPAAAADIYYRAELAAPVSTSQAIAGGVAWVCKGNVCIAGKGQSRPLRICRALSRELGEVTQFAVKGETMSEDKLATCNDN